MKNLKKMFFAAAACLLAVTGAYAQTAGAAEGDRVVTFRFVPGRDMFYIPWAGNDAELNRLYSLVDQYRTEITSGTMPVFVDGYCASLPTARENRNTAFIRANRVKSELITKKGLLEEHFVTKNYTTPYEDHKDMVVVTVRIPAKEQPRRPEPPREQPRREAPPAARQPESAQQPRPAIEEPAPRYSRWSAGVNAGVPFFWGDMVSMADGKTYFGLSAGVQATYQISPLLGVTLSADWMQNRAGARGYSKNYLLGGDAMTYYTPQAGMTHAYKDLYSKVSAFGAGLSLDVNMNRVFGQQGDRKFTAILSPTLYGLSFSSKVYTKQGDTAFTPNTLGKTQSLGAGGSLALRWNLSPALDLQFKNTVLWLPNGDFDGVTTIGEDRNSALWNSQLGLVWKIGGRRNTNLLYGK